MKDTQHTLQTKVLRTAAKLSAVSQKATKRQVAGILSLCVLAITSATLVMYSQEAGTRAAETAATAETLPATRTITDLKGRAMEGTILSKSDTAITFERTADKKKFEVKLDTLSGTDRAFIAGLAEDVKTPPVAIPPGKKASLLYVIAWDESYYETWKEQIKWLKTNGFDVTIALVVEEDPFRIGEVPKGPVKWLIGRFEDPTIHLNPISIMDQYDIVWIPFFHGIDNRDRPTRYTITKHRNSQGGITVIPCHERDARKKSFFSVDGGSSIRKDPKNYVGHEDNWIFYWEEVESSKTESRRQALKTGKEATRLKLLQEIEKLLIKP